MAKFVIMTEDKISELGRKFPPKSIYGTNDVSLIDKLRAYKPEIITEIKETISGKKIEIAIDEKPIEIKANEITKKTEKKDNRGIRGVVK